MATWVDRMQALEDLAKSGAVDLFAFFHPLVSANTHAHVSIRLALKVLLINNVQPPAQAHWSPLRSQKILLA